MEDEKIKLDKNLKTAEERTALVNLIVSNSTPDQLTPYYLAILSNYICEAQTLSEKKSKKILTQNRAKTVYDRETSLEGLCEKLENGENGLYNMTSDLGKTAILSPKDNISDAETALNADLTALRAAIDRVEKQMDAASGKRKFLLKKQIKEMWQDMHVIRNERRGTWNNRISATTKSIATINLYDSFSIDAEGNPQNRGIVDFFNPQHIEALLCNYSELKECGWGKHDQDLWYMMEDLDNLIELALREEYPLYYDLLIYKIDGLSNVEIQRRLKEKHGVSHSIEYISSLWRNKIPKIVAETAETEYLLWYYNNKEHGKWKRCSRCGEIKLANNKFFSKNKTSKDGWYSLCKCCRNAGIKKNKDKSK